MEKQTHIYKVSVCNPYGFTEDNVYFWSKEDAEEELALRIESRQKKLPMASQDDLDGRNPVQEVEIEEGDETTVKRIALYYWEKCSHEYDEWDIYPEEIVLEQLKIR